MKRAHFQCIVWYNDTVANQNIPSPSEYEWREEAGGILSCNDYHGSSSWGNIKTSEKRGCT